jgi:serpin B
MMARGAANERPQPMPNSKAWNRSLAVLTATLCLALAAGPARAAENPDAGNPNAKTLDVKIADIKALTQAFNASGHDLFLKLSAAQPGNVVLSPYSIGTAMAMVLSGARGDTESAMKAALKQTLPREAMDAANKSVMDAFNGYGAAAGAPACPAGMTLKDDRCDAEPGADRTCGAPSELKDGRCVAAPKVGPTAKLLIANALMLTKYGDAVAKEYIALLATQYGAEAFRNAALDDVNGWVAKKTDGKIEKILEQLDERSVAVLLNAIYFKAAWSAAFAQNRTADAPFAVAGREATPVPTMRRTGEYALAAREGYRAIRMPYSVKALSMIVVLPEAADGVNAVAEKLVPAEFAALTTALHDAKPETADLMLPRFSASFDASLVDAFKALGLTAPFEASADFSGITGKPAKDAPISIGQIRHRAVIEVQEEGTVAAAATGVELVLRSARPVQAEPFHVDRPFLFYVVDDATGAVLFQGRVTDPRG